MAKKKNQAAKDLEQVNQALGRAEQFIENNQKNLLIGLAVIILLVIAGLGIYYGYLAPREREAENKIYQGQLYFEQDSLQLALKGDGMKYIGFEEISRQYKHTKTGKLAAAYAGIIYYRLGDQAKALDLLKKFSPGDNMIDPSIAGLIGDCYIDAGKVSEAIRYFEEGAKKADNALVSPYLLKKAAAAYESEGKYDAALKNYQTIKDKYFQSQQAADIDKYIEKIRLTTAEK